MEEVTEEKRLRFWSKVNIVHDADSCWEWTDYLGVNGYGIFRMGKSRHNASRVAWALTSVVSIVGKLVCHRCDNRKCVRPSHLFVGTHSDNSQDMRAKDRHCRGERSGMSKLRDVEVLEIRQLLALGVTHKRLGTKFGVTKFNIQAIALGKTWKHLGVSNGPLSR